MRLVFLLIVTIVIILGCSVKEIETNHDNGIKDKKSNVVITINNKNGVIVNN